MFSDGVGKEKKEGEEGVGRGVGGGAVLGPPRPVHPPVEGALGRGDTVRSNVSMLLTAGKCLEFGGKRGGAGFASPVTSEEEGGEDVGRGKDQCVPVGGGVERGASLRRLLSVDVEEEDSRVPGMRV